MNPKKQTKVYVTILLFILYSMFHVESPKYKMICLKSREFAKKNIQTVVKNP